MARHPRRAPRDGARGQLGDLVRYAPDWIVASGGEHEPRRRLAAATYMLEVLEQHGRSNVEWSENQPAYVALEWACTLLRQGEPRPPEQWWYTASIGLLERAGATGPLIKHLSHIEARFPGQPRWTLARAVAEELIVWRQLNDDRQNRIRPEVADRIAAAFTRAAILEPSRAEAHLRWGYDELRLGHVDEALTHFDLVGNLGDDSYLRYWLHLFKGQALQRAGRRKDAIVAYEAASAAVPYAQSAALSLSAALVEDRRPSEAAALMIRILAVQPAVQDSWLAYLAPEMRFFGPLIGQLRRSSVRP